MDDIREKFENSGRILYLDNFIGNYNETLLLPIFEDYRDKIVFVSAAYEKMFNYVSTEFLSDVRYLSLKYQKILFNDSPKYIPQKYQEVEIYTQKVDSKPTWALEGILKELGFSSVIIGNRAINIQEHRDVYSVLAYEIFPYCLDILNKKPYEERLLKYFEKDFSGASQTLLRWFPHE